jgi:hypothetical protein
MISLLLATFPFFGWMTEQMMYDQQQAQQSNEADNQASAASGQQTEESQPSSPYQTTVKTNVANQQGIYWLGLTDQSQFPSSWLALSPITRDIISQEQWVAAMKGTRTALGSVRSRKLESTDELKQLPSGIPGKFTRLTYRTQFSGGNAKEILILMGSKGPQEQWRVVSYRIQK